MRESALRFSLLILLKLITCTAASSPSVPMLFVFGDSFVDSGNNNHLNTTAQANHLPYGINFLDGRPTGRWSDGRIITDYLADYLGISYPPDFLDITNTSHGANFGSAGSGILNITHIGGEVLTLTDQVNLFGRYRQMLDGAVGRRLGMYYTTRAIFYINIGNNDVNDYVQDNNATIPYDFRSRLLREMQEKVQTLYRLGARKIIVTSIYATGCAPMYQSQGTCDQLGLHAASYYNEGLFALTIALQASLRDLVIVYANTYQVMIDIHQQPATYGIHNVTKPCCPTVDRPSARWCYTSDSYCTNPGTYLFWDTAHPTDMFNRIASQRFWNGSRRYVFPFNVQTLARL